VPAQVLGGGIDDDGGAMVEGPHQQGRRRIVHDQGDAELPPDSGHLGDGEDFEFRVGQGLCVVGAGPLIRGPPEVLGIGGIHKADLDALVLQRVGEQVPGAAVERGRGDNIVAGPGQVLEGVGRGGLTRGHRQGADAALQRGDALLQDVRRGVHDPGVDVPQFLEPEEGGRVARVPELVGRGLVDGDRHRPCGGIRPPSGVEDKGFGMLGSVGHLRFLARRTGPPS
jgi:hypothetical protein